MTAAVLDDRLLIEELLVGVPRRREAFYTTTYWYDISLPDARSTVPEMARLAGHHPHLNLMNLEAVALGRLLGGTVWLSRESARGILPGVLDHEHVRWRTVPIE